MTTTKVNMVKEIVSPTRGIIGWMHEVECQANDSVLIFQLPRTTQQISNSYLDDAKDTVSRLLPPGRNAMIIGCDVNIFEIAGPDMLILKLKGLV